MAFNGDDVFFPTRCLEFNGKTVRVLLQNQRFQSCIIALTNGLILQGEVSLGAVPSSPVTVVASSTSRIGDSVALVDVVSLLHNYLLDHPSASQQESEDEDEDIGAVLMSLAKNVDVHYNLTDVTVFQTGAPTATASACDAEIVSPQMKLLRRFATLRLVHGLQVDEADLVIEIADRSFQCLCELVEKENLTDVQQEEQLNATGDVSAAFGCPKDTTVPLFRGWWSIHKGELSFEGIAQLHRVLNNGDIVLFHRLGHFAVLTKQRDALFSLVTDVNIVESMPHSPWATVADIDGCETDYANEIFFVHNESAPSPQRFQQPRSGREEDFDEEDGPPPPPRRNSQLVKRGEAGTTGTAIMLNKEVVSGRDLQRRASLQPTPESSPQQQRRTPQVNSGDQQQPSAAAQLDLGTSQQQKSANKDDKKCCVVM